MNKIIIKDLKLFAYHGVNPEEKENGQNFVFDITADVDFLKARKSDDLNDTVSYASMIKTVRRVFCEGKDDLLEYAAERVAAALLKEYPKINSVDVILKKPEAPIKADFNYVAVEITKSREELLNE